MSVDRISEALERAFGFPGLRPGQRPVLEDVLAGTPTIAVMPTGSGKSLLYQLPAVMLDGLTVVVSPLISLMKDQVDALNERGIRAGLINSSQTLEEQRSVEQAARSGSLALLYVAPERFQNAWFRSWITELKVALVAVDEAHCISRWGHDFRPDYRLLGDAIPALRPGALLACTATATPDVQADIAQALGWPSPAVHVSGFLRDNLHLEVRFCGSDRAKHAQLLKIVQQPPATDGAVIVYASTRKRVEAVSELLATSLGEPVAAYHGGMEAEDRTAAQDLFMQGGARIAVATNAFGMGVDRGDVRSVIHVEMPRTIEGYYQEVGRAGRDGAPARCVMLYNPNDSRVHEFLIERGDSEEHREHEGRKLRDMKRFVHGEECRHVALLQYFGDDAAIEACPGCDRCTATVRTTPAEPPDASQVEVIRKALAGVARARGRFGLGKVAKMLGGSGAAEVRKAGLDQLSTYGILSWLGVSGCTELLSLLVQQGCCRVAGGDYPLLQITEEGGAVMRGDRAPWFHLPLELRGGGLTRTEVKREVRQASASRATDEAFADADPELVEALRGLRAELAGGKPAYTVFSNRTLAALAAAEPRSEAEFLAVPGLGAGKWSRYGEAILGVIEAVRG
jgi:ATP-dependent DNA helicase RecQ